MTKVYLKTFERLKIRIKKSWDTKNLINFFSYLPIYQEET